MWRWLTWAARIAATALLLSFLSIWTTGYIVNSYMETLLKQLNLPLQTQPFVLSGLWGKLWGASPVPGEQAGEGKDDPASAYSPSRDGKRGGSGADAPSAGQGEGNGGSRAEGQSGRDSKGSQVDGQGNRGNEGTSAGGQSGPGDESPPLDGQDGPGEGGLPPGKGNGSSSDGTDRNAGEPNGAQAPIEEDTGESAAGGLDGAVPVFGGQENAAVLSEEQRQALSAIMSKLNGEQLGALSGYLEDGLTPDELASVQELLKAALTESEYAQMMEALSPGRANENDSTGTP